MDAPRARPVVAVGLVAVVVSLAFLLVDGASASGHGPVHRVEVSGEIDLGLAPFLDRAVVEAEADGAAAVLVVIDTPGGRLDAVLQMRDTLLRAAVPTVAFVDATAFSAGALVALAAEEVHMVPGGVIGAATPVDAGTGAPADEKVVAAVRSVFRATAEERGRDPRVAEAMVDPDIEVEGLVERGQLLSMTAPEAVEWGLADGLAADEDEVLAGLGLGQAQVVDAEVTLAERIVRFITNPVLAGLLLTAGMWLVIGNVLSGNLGLASAVGIALLGLFFWGHLLAGLAGWEDVVLVVLGIALILVEVFVVPGFGVPGLFGLAALLGGSFLAMVNRDFDFVGAQQLGRAGLVVGTAFAVVVAGTVLLLSHLSRSGGPDGLVLRAGLGSGTPVTHRASGGWLGWFGAGGGVLASDRDHDRGEEDGLRPRRLAPGTLGVARTDLRPSGMAEIEGERVDVVTDGEYLGAGTPIEVVRDDGYRRVVRRASTP